MKKIIVLLVSLSSLALANIALAEGFKVKDLRNLNVEISGFKGGKFVPKVGQTKLSLLCPNCAGTGINISLSKITDDTEASYRSGETKIEEMEALCKSRSLTCKLKAVEVAGAVGWVTEYSVTGAIAGSTLVVFKDGDLLMIRSVSRVRQVTDENMSVAMQGIALAIVGD